VRLARDSLKGKPLDIEQFVARAATYIFQVEWEEIKLLPPVLDV